MEYRKLGKSGVQVSVLSLGTWLTFGNQIGDETAEELMTIAYENGINFFDSAEGYAAGRAEECLGRLLTKLHWDRSSYMVSSKVFFGSRAKPSPNQHGLSRKHIVEACHDALRRMQVDYLDLYFCHRSDPSVPIAEIVRTMNTLIQQGKILYWGTSEWTAAQIMEAHRVADQLGLEGPTMEQPQYNLFWREKVEKDFLDIYKTVGLGTTIWSPLASGTLTERYVSGIPEQHRFSKGTLKHVETQAHNPDRMLKIKALYDFANEIGTTLPTLAIAWCLKNPNVSTVILGASKAAQLRENIAALDFVPKLTPSVLERLEVIVDNKPQIIVM
jgi:voltage-dependent potassium channel beta subunit